MIHKYNKSASLESINKTVQALVANGFQAEIVETRGDALQRIKSLIPQGATVHNGSSVTLQEIGYIDYLKSGNHGWNNLHATILAETDPDRQSKLRHDSTFSDYYLGSVHALTETGELVIASNSGSQLPHLAYTSPNVILVVGCQKIAPNLDQALKRLEDYVVPLEDKRALEAYKSHTMHTKTLILHKENPKVGRSVKVLLVKEPLGF
jgi:L-lactate utilization protein LutB